MEIAGSEIHNGKQLIVTSATGASALVPKRVFRDVHKHYWEDVVPLFLPSGNYTVSFVDQDGTTSNWPGYAYFSLGSAPSCANYVEEANIIIDYPAPNDRCNNPIYNGDIERGNFYGFQDAGRAGMAIVTPGAAGTNNALRTTKTNRAADEGLYNHMDVSCLRAWAGKDIRLSGYLRTLVRTLDNTYADAASTVSVTLTVSGTATALVSTEVPTNNDGSWAFFQTVIELPPTVADATKATLVIDGAAQHHIVLDEWQIKVDPCENDPDWRHRLPSGSTRACTWIGRSPDSRCASMGIDGTSSYEGCPEYCANYCKPCENDPGWRTEIQPGEYRACEWVGRNTGDRCSSIGTDADDTPAVEGCRVHCDPNCIVG